MTLKETCNRLYDLALGGNFNGEKFTKSGLYKYVRSYMADDNCTQVFMVIELPDGHWFCKVTEYAPGQYDYYIPETRMQERDLMKRMTKNREVKYEG